MTSNQTFSSSQRTQLYNNSINEDNLSRIEIINPKEINTLRYSRPHDECDGIALHVGNQAGGFPFRTLGYNWKSVEHLYLCGEFSNEGDTYKTIQEDINTATSGYAAKIFKKNKYKKNYLRSDFPVFRTNWMMWCIWQKCLNNSDFRNHLLSLPDDYTVVEVVKKDPVWATYYDDRGNLVGANGVGKILTICRRCLQEGSSPHIDTALLNSSNIYILGKRVLF